METILPKVAPLQRLKDRFVRVLQVGMRMRTRVGLSLDAAVIRDARALGLDIARIAETATTAAARLERNRRWREANRAALEAHAQEVAANGLPLARFRSV